MKISVTQEHIDRSPSTTDIHNCPIALCLRDMGYKNIAVGASDVDFGENKNIPFQVVFDEMVEFIARPTPREFELEIPDGN